MVEGQGLDEVAKLLRNERGVGRVIGARPGEGASCDVELVLISRLADGYLLRSAVVDLNRLNEVRDHLFAVPARSALTAEDLTVSTLEGALQSARTIELSTRAEPVPGLAPWQDGDTFKTSLKRARVRSQIAWLPQPPRWWRITRGILAGAWCLLVVCLVFAPFAVPSYFGLDPSSLMWWVVMVLSFGLGVVLSVTGDWADGVLDRVDRRLERHHDGPGSSTTQPMHLSPTTGDGVSADPHDHAVHTPRGARVADFGVPPGRGRSESFMVRGEWRFWYLSGWAAVALAVAWFMSWPDAWGGEPLPRIWPPVVVLVLVSLLAAYRAYRRGVGADPAGVTVVNFRRTHRIRWQDLREISYRGRYLSGDEMVCALEFLLNSGVTVPATIPSGDRSPGGRLDALRDRMYAVREAAHPGQFETRPVTDGQAQVVTVHRHRLESAAVEVAVIIPMPEDRYRHRRVGCRGIDLSSELAQLFDPEPALLRQGGDPSAPRWVLDRDFDTIENALLAAPQDVLAPLDGWRDKVEFCSWVQGSEFADSVRPEAEHVRRWGRIVLGVVALTVFAAAIYVGYRFNVWVGLDTPPAKGSMADTLYAGVLFVAALVPAVWVHVWLGRVFSQRNLAAEAAREQKARGTRDTRRATADGASVRRVSAPPAPEVERPVDTPRDGEPPQTRGIADPSRSMSWPANTEPHEDRAATPPPGY